MFNNEALGGAAYMTLPAKILFTLNFKLIIIIVVVVVIKVIINFIANL